MPESRRDPQAYDRFLRCIWDEFIIPDNILAAPPVKKSKYRLDLDKSEPAVSHRPVVVESEHGRRCGNSQSSRRLGFKRQRIAYIPSMCALAYGSLEEHGQARVPLLSIFPCSGTVRAGLHFHFQHKPTPIDALPPLEPQRQPSAEVPEPRTLESLPVELLQLIFAQTRDPYSMVCLALASRKLLSVAAGFKSCGSLSHECIDGTLAYHRRYHGYEPNNTNPDPKVANRIFDFLSRIGPIGDRRFFHVCVSCRKWKTTDYEISIERATAVGQAEMVIGETRKSVTPEEYVAMWARRPKMVDHFCPACLLKKGNVDQHVVATQVQTGPHPSAGRRRLRKHKRVTVKTEAEK